MLNTLQKSAWIAAFVFLVCAIGLSAWRGSSRTTQPPQQQPVTNQGQANEQTAKAEDKGIFAKFVSALGRFIIILDQHNGLVSAIGTLFVAIFTGVLVLATIALFISSEKVADASKKAAEAATKSADVAKDTLVATTRPWISLEFSIDGPLAYDAIGWEHGVRWHIPLTYQLKNYGRTPAINAAFFAHIVPVVLGYETPEGIKGINLPKELAEACRFQEMMTGVGFSPGKIIFQEEPWVTGSFEVQGRKERFDEAKTALSHYAGTFLVIGCVTYGSTNNSDIYQTSKAIYLGKKSGAIDLNGERIDLVDLITSAPLLHGNFAN